ncbi:diguanylate cyclase domain-containing protein [Patescibacteria group bacterium]
MAVIPVERTDREDEERGEEGRSVEVPSVADLIEERQELLQQEEELLKAWEERLARYPEAVAAHSASIEGQYDEALEAFDGDEKALNRALREHESDQRELERITSVVDRSRAWVEYDAMRFDNTGALKRKNLAAEFMFQVDPEGLPAQLEAMRREVEMRSGEQEPPPVSFEGGFLKLQEGAPDRRFLFVNMGELDRINKEGKGHAAGDAALRSTSNELRKLMYRTMADKGLDDPDSAFALYRFSGNEFCISLGGLDDGEAAKLKRAIGELRPEVPAGVEPPPLVAAETSFNDSIEMFNDMQAQVAAERRADDAGTAGRETFGLMLDQASFMLDIRKFESRIGRMRDMIRRGQEEGDPDLARKFYDNYLKKTFAGVEGLDSTETDIETVIGSFERLDNVGISELAFEFARRNRGVETGIQVKLTEATDAAAREARARTSTIMARRIELERGTADRPEGKTDESIATIGEPNGLQELAKKRELFEEADADLKRSEEIAAEQRDGLKIDFADLGSEEAASSSDLSELVEGGVDQVRIEHETRAIEYLSERERRDLGTGLLERGVLYEDLEAEFKQGETVGERRLIFIDMGFLKYFDRGGGKDVGDRALKFAAILMEKAAKAAGKDKETKKDRATVYRYAGDEFAIKVNGGDEEVKAVIEDLEHHKDFDGAVGQGRLGAQNGYYPTRLSFNYGVSDPDRARKVLDDMLESGDLQEDRIRDRNNLLAETLVNIADKALEVDKAADRFRLLIDRLRDPRYADEPGPDGVNVFRTQTEQMINYSGKALFSEAAVEDEQGNKRGGVELLREWAASGRDFKDLQPEIDQFVEGQVAAARKKDGQALDLKERLIELEAEGEYFRRKLAETQARFEGVEEDNEGLKKRIAQLERQVESTREERLGIIAQREKIKGAEERGEQ